MSPLGTRRVPAWQRTKVQGECATRSPTSTTFGRVPKSVQALLPTWGPNQTSQRSALAPART
eukprot:8315398-Heterocapsa_arctica.AAC.1